jgi:hypothetical protein
VSQSGHNTRISRFRHGCRLPFETRDAGDGYASPGEVKTYRLGPEELARYGPVTDPARAQWIRAKHRGLVGPVKEDEDMGKLKEAMEKLPREKLEAMLAEGRKHTEIMAEYGISVGTFYLMLEEYGLKKARQGDNPGGGNGLQTPVNGSKNVENCRGNSDIPEPANQPARTPENIPHGVPGEAREGHNCACRQLDISGVACLLPWAVDDLADAAGRDLQERVLALLRLWDETSQKLRQAIETLNDLEERLDDLERKYRHHRHQVGPGHWSGKAEV